MNALTQNELKRLLNYDPDTGIFTWLNPSGYKMKPGDRAGANDCGYVCIGINGKTQRAHRLAFLYMTGRFPKITDHINHIKNDNRWANLREVDSVANCRNRPPSLINRHNKYGIQYVEKDGLWRATIGNKGKSIHLGAFESKDLAIAARIGGERALGYHDNHGKEKTC